MTAKEQFYKILVRYGEILCDFNFTDSNNSNLPTRITEFYYINTIYMVKQVCGDVVLITEQKLGL